MIKEMSSPIFRKLVRRGPLRTLTICIALLVVISAATSVSVSRYLSTLELWVGGFPFRPGPPMYVTARLHAPPSIWRRFVRVQNASFIGTYHESTNAWLSDPPDPTVDCIRLPEFIGGPYQFGKKPAQLPLQGAIPPLNVLFEVHAVRPYDESPPAITATVYYRFLFLRRHLIWRSPDLW